MTQKETLDEPRAGSNGVRQSSRATMDEARDRGCFGCSGLVGAHHDELSHFWIGC